MVPWIKNLCWWYLVKGFRERSMLGTIYLEGSLYKTDVLYGMRIFCLVDVIIVCGYTNSQKGTHMQKYIEEQLWFFIAKIMMQ